MAGIFGRIREAIFGQRQGRLARQQQAVTERRRRAGGLSERASQAQEAGEAQVAAARKRQQAARIRGDKAGLAQAVADELKAMDYTKRQKLEREEQDRREKAASQELEQTVRELEKFKAKARSALLKTRKNIAKRGEPWPFAGPAPKMPKEYANVNAGDGSLPDAEAFLMGVKYTAFASSNVVAMQFDPRHGGDLYIQYKKKGFYMYPRVGAAFALHMYGSASKGIFVHDEIRVRGENPRLPSPPASTRKAFKRGVHPPVDLPLQSSAATFAAGGGGL